MHLKFGHLFDVKIDKEGSFIVSISLISTLLSLAVSGLHSITLIFAFISFILVFFFRDPTRIMPKGENIIISPADGKIIDLNISKLPNELEISDDQDYYKIGIFLNIFDVHSQRIPISGNVELVQYFSGTFLNATSEKCSEENERNYILISHDSNKKILMCQIAGFLARRISCYNKVGDSVYCGEKCGFIKFGSKVDIYIPANCAIKVSLGQSMIAGETILATL